MPCEQLDHLWNDLSGLADWVLALVLSCLLVASALLLFAGERCAKPLAVLVATGAAASSVYTLTSVWDGLDCTARLISGGIAGGVAGVLALCLLKWSVLILAAGAGGTIGLVLYDALPLDLPTPYRYASSGVCACLSAALSCVAPKRALRVASAVVGGGGVALSVHLIVLRSSGDALPAGGIIGVTIGSAAVGLLVQHFCRRRATIPVGVPVESVQ